MNKKFLVSIVVLIILILAGCKNSGDNAAEKLKEKRACYKECMLLENDKSYCLDYCNIEETEIEEKTTVCGDGVCQTAEISSGLCPADCGCTVEADCDIKEICQSGTCMPVDCKLNSDCPVNMECADYSCVKIQILDTVAIGNMQTSIEDLQSDMQSMLDEINGLQGSLDAADASEDDKNEIQDDIDVLDTTITQLKTYNATLTGYLEDLDEVETNVGLTTIGTAFNTTNVKVMDYMEVWQEIIDDIQDAIDILEPTEKSDLTIDDFDLDDIEEDEAICIITVKNNGEGNITTSETLRVQLTSYGLDNNTHDESRATITSGLEPDAETDVELSVEIIDIENYFIDNPKAISLVLQFLVKLDIDNSINESDETNNNETFNVTFDRDDYISNNAPVANITVSPSNASVAVNETVAFSSTGSTDSDGSISSYNWDFGDTYSSTSSAPTHSYTSAGTYKIVLIVTDNEGATDTEIVVVTVS